MKKEHNMIHSPTAFMKGTEIWLRYNERPEPVRQMGLAYTPNWDWALEDCPETTEDSIVIAWLEELPQNQTEG